MSTGTQKPIYRVDKFTVPAAGREEFLGRVAQTQAFLERQEGFIRGLVLEQTSGPGVFNFVTIVEWASVDVVERVTAAVARFHKESGFDRQELLRRLGITADIATYTALPV
jgi:hypothetical protein